MEKVKEKVLLSNEGLTYLPHKKGGQHDVSMLTRGSGFILTLCSHIHSVWFSKIYQLQESHCLVQIPDKKEIERGKASTEHFNIPTQ